MNIIHWWYWFWAGSTAAPPFNPRVLFGNASRNVLLVGGGNQMSLPLAGSATRAVVFVGIAAAPSSLRTGLASRNTTFVGLAIKS